LEQISRIISSSSKNLFQLVHSLIFQCSHFIHIAKIGQIVLIGAFKLFKNSFDRSRTG